jgi:actin-related protein
VVPSALPMPQVSALLNVLFKKFHALQVSLFSSATMATVGAGVRSALVVDLGWAETVVTSVYEYREVRTTRSVRGGRMLVDATHEVLRREMAGGADTDDAQQGRQVVSFEECEEVCTRLMWCRPAAAEAAAAALGADEGLSTVQEQDESEPRPPTSSASPSRPTVVVPLKSTDRPTTVTLPFDSLADACEQTFVAPSQDHAAFDDDELPVHLVMYNHLVQLPVDVRAVCMSRIIFTGGCANVLGLRQRIFDELAALGERRQWSPITGKHFVDRTRRRGDQSGDLGGGGDAENDVGGRDEGRNDGGDDDDDNNDDDDDASSLGSGASPTNTTAAASRPRPPPSPADPAERELRKHRARQPPSIQGTLRAVDTTGAWAGASLMAHLRVTAMAQIDRDAWVKQGAAGASRPGEVDVRMQQRHSMGGGSVLKPGEQSWTLGVWGGL